MQSLRLVNPRPPSKLRPNQWSKLPLCRPTHLRTNHKEPILWPLVPWIKFTNPNNFIRSQNILCNQLLNHVVWAKHSLILSSEMLCLMNLLPLWDMVHGSWSYHLRTVIQSGINGCSKLRKRQMGQLNDSKLGLWPRVTVNALRWITKRPLVPL